MTDGLVYLQRGGEGGWGGVEKERFDESEFQFAFHSRGVVVFFQRMPHT